MKRLFEVVKLYFNGASGTYRAKPMLFELPSFRSELLQLILALVCAVVEVLANGKPVLVCDPLRVILGFSDTRLGSSFAQTSGSD